MDSGATLCLAALCCPMDSGATLCLAALCCHMGGGEYECYPAALWVLLPPTNAKVRMPRMQQCEMDQRCAHT
eukprot:gene11496-biopygen2332